MPNDLPKGLDATQGGREPRQPGQRPGDDASDAERSTMSAGSRAHGTHGKGRNDELLVDEQATDTGDDPQLRRAGGGGDQAPDPQRFRDNAAGRMGGAGWGSEQVGGSTVDRRPSDPQSGDDRRNA